MFSPLILQSLIWISSFSKSNTSLSLWDRCVSIILVGYLSLRLHWSFFGIIHVILFLKIILLIFVLDVTLKIFLRSQLVSSSLDNHILFLEIFIAKITMTLLSFKCIQYNRSFFSPFTSSNDGFSFGQFYHVYSVYWVY